MSQFRSSEQGSVTPFVVITSLAVIMLAALVIDGGRQLNGRGRAIAYAQEAARAGAQAVDIADPRLDLDPQLALRAARAYCSQAQQADAELVVCRPTVTTVREPGRPAYRAVTVTAQIRFDAILLGIIGRSVLSSEGSALARPVSGISEPDDAKVPTVSPPSVGSPSPEASSPPAAPRPIETLQPCIPRDEAEDDDEEPDDDPPPEGGDDERPICPEPRPDGD